MESVLIVERDDNGDALVSWRYPNVDVADEKVVIARSGLESGVPDASSFFFSKFRARFFYSWVIVPGGGRVKAFCVTLVTGELWPEKYGSLCRLFAKQLAASPVPTPVLQSFLSALTRGRASAGMEGVPDWEGPQFSIKVGTGRKNAPSPLTSFFARRRTWRGRCRSWCGTWGQRARR